MSFKRAIICEIQNVPPDEDQWSPPRWSNQGDTEPSYLTDDLYLAVLPTDYHIDVGWFPEGDPTGSYEVCGYLKVFEYQPIDPIEARTLPEVVAVIERLALEYSRNLTATSRSA